MLEHEFTEKIFAIINENLGEDDIAEDIYLRSGLLQYINLKTKSVNSDSKSRGAYAPLYVMYALIEDYINNNYHKQEDYCTKYKGARFTDLKKVVNSLPFGDKIQNHHFNNRLDSEFKAKLNETNNEFLDKINKVQIILRVSDLPEQEDKKSKMYWFNEELLKIKYKGTQYNIAEIVLSTLQEYIRIKEDGFKSYINYLTDLKNISKKDSYKVVEFIEEQLKPNSDARTFEIVAYAILKYYFEDKTIHWGWSKEVLNKENLILYKTGRTNANDGGIDYVMKPLGIFFQVTETLNFKKYFLDIDKVQKFPITFVVKSELKEEELLPKIRNNAKEIYGIEIIIEKYMKAIEEVISIPKLKNYLNKNIENGKTKILLDEIILQSQVEFNYSEE